LKSSTGATARQSYVGTLGRQRCMKNRSGLESVWFMSLDLQLDDLVNLVSDRRIRIGSCQFCSTGFGSEMRKARSGSQDPWLQVAATYAINSIEVSMMKPCILHQIFFTSVVNLIPSSPEF